MSLNQLAIVPHPPLLISSIGKDNIILLKKTLSSYKKLEEKLKEEKIDTIIVISSHGKINSDFFSISESDNYKINFEEFGDYTAKLEIKSDKELIDIIKNGFSTQKEIKILHEEKLDHGNGVPITLLCNELRDIKIVPIHISGLSLREHFYFGKKLKTLIEQYKKRVAVIASGDLSHTLDKKAPAGYSARASRFDQKIIEYIQNNKVADILNLKKELIEEVKPCGISSITILLGVLKGVNYEITNTTYEAPFGVGYLSMKIDIKK